LERYKTTVAWLNNPTSLRNRKYSRAIYTQLVDDGVIPPASADALLGTNKIRWQHVTDSLHEAYRANPAAVERAVGAILDADAQNSWRNQWPFNKLPEIV
jgi:hypothetical protein